MIVNRSLETTGRSVTDTYQNTLITAHNRSVNMTEIFSSLYGQPDPQGSAGASALGFGPGKPQVPQNLGSMCFPHQMVDEGAQLRKPAAMNEPFYLLRELPSKCQCYIDLIMQNAGTIVWGRGMVMICNNHGITNKTLFC